MIDFSEYLNQQRIEVKKDLVIRLICKQHKGFNSWFNNKFLSWEYDVVNHEDVDNLNTSVQKVLIELDDK